MDTTTLLVIVLVVLLLGGGGTSTDVAPKVEWEYGIRVDVATLTLFVVISGAAVSGCGVTGSTPEGTEPCCITTGFEVSGLTTEQQRDLVVSEDALTRLSWLLQTSDSRQAGAQ